MWTLPYLAVQDGTEAEQLECLQLGGHWWGVEAGLLVCQQIRLKLGVQVGGEMVFCVNQ